MSRSRFVMLLSATAVVLFGIFFGLMVAANSIDRNLMFDHIAESGDILIDEGMYSRRWMGGFVFYQKDNFTDAIILTSGKLPTDTGSVVERAMLCKFNNYFLTGYDRNDTSGFRERLAEGIDINATSGYPRYWHGYQAVVNPMLVFFSLKEIRIINSILLYGLFALTLVMMWRKLSLGIALSYLLAVMLMGFPTAPDTLQFTPCYYIAFLALLTVMSSGRLRRSNPMLYIFFFAVGAVAQFFDFLTFPLITLGLPLVAAYLMKARKWPDTDSDRALLIRGFRFAILCMLFWAVGYAMLWASKWVLAQYLLGIDVIGDALAEVILRIGGKTHEPQIFKHGLTEILGMVVVVVSVIVFAIVWWLSGKSRYHSRIVKYSPLILVAFVPLIWVSVVRNHTFLHLWFVWRIGTMTMFAALAFITKVFFSEKSIGCGEL